MVQHFGNSTIQDGNLLNVNGDYHFSIPGNSGAPQYFLSLPYTAGTRLRKSIVNDFRLTMLHVHNNSGKQVTLPARKK
jgi:hypothetical protein